MSIPLALIQADRNELVSVREDTQDQVNLLTGSQSVNAVDFAKLLLIDIPFKKQTDSPHADIFYYEEELRRLIGISVPQPLQETSFTISDSVSPARLYVNNGRVKLVEGPNTLDVSIIPIRGYSASTIRPNNNFDIWSRDRFGSSTSKPNVSSTFTISLINSSLTANINGDEQTIDFTELFTLPQIMDGGTLASSLQAIFQSIEVGSTLSKNQEPYIIYEGDTIGLSVNGGSVQTATFTKPDKLSVYSYEQDWFTFVNGDILNLSIDEGSKKPLIFIFPPDDQGRVVERSTITIEETAIRMNNAWSGMTVSIDTSTGNKRLKFELDMTGYHNFSFSNESNLPGIGTVSTNGSINVLGTNTKFTETFQPGNRITIQGETSFQHIATIVDDTHLTTILPVSVTGTNIGYYYVGSGNSDPISTFGLSDEMYGTLSAQDIITVLSSWTDINFFIEDNYIRASSSFKFQITDGVGNPNKIIGFSEHLILQNTNFQTCSMLFNSENKAFTLVSGVAGPTSTAQVLASPMRDDLGFDSQYLIIGRYANNLLNVEIDGTSAEIQIADFRLCFTDTLLGKNNDDIGYLWSNNLGYSGTTRVGPLFCSGINNGKEVAKSIQSQLRAVGTGGFENARCYFFTDKQQFYIYSGSFGVNSSVRVLAASDSNRDCRDLLGFDPPSEEIGHENYYYTIGELASVLSTWSPNVIVSTPVDPDVAVHSILYQNENGVKLDSNFQLFPFITTTIYDNASLGLPRLYPNGTLTIDATNDKINFWEQSYVEIAGTIAHGTYTTGDLALAIQDAMNAVTENSVTYTVKYQATIKKFVIYSSASTVLLWNSGQHKVTSIGNAIGFNVSSDSVWSTIHTADREETFTGNYFYPTIIGQFYDPSNIRYLAGIDDTVDEQSAIIKESEILNIEGIPDTLLADIRTETVYDNETKLNCWETFQAIELIKVQQEYAALLTQIACYANHISEADAEITNKQNAVISLQPNKDNLETFTSHAKLLNLTADSDIFTAGIDFTQGGTEQLSINIPAGSFDSRIYNRPPPYVHYNLINKHIAGRWNPYGLFGISADYTKEDRVGFSIVNTRTGTAGYSYSGPQVSGTFTIPDATSASVLSSNAETYNMDPNNQLSFKIDGGSTQQAVVNATAGYTESRLAKTSGFVVKTGTNDKIDFEETVSTQLTATLTAGYYDGAGLATQIQTRLNAAGASNYTVDWNVSNAGKFTIVSDGSGGGFIFNLLWNTGTNTATSAKYILGFNNTDDTGGLTYFSDNTVYWAIQTNVNTNFTISIDNILCASTIVISQGLYTSATLITEIATQIAADASFIPTDFNVTYIGSKFIITSTTKGTDSIIEVYEGVTNDFLRTITMDGDTPSYGGGDVGDITAVTAAEVANVLNADITGIAASTSSNKVLVQTISTGLTSSIEIINDTARTIVGFSLSTYFGTNAQNQLKVDIDGDTTKQTIILNTGTNIPAATVATNIQNQLNAIGSGGYANASCTWNETTLWDTFINELRIESGSFGSTSSVDVTDKVIEIVVLSNDSIDFTIGGVPPEYNVIIDPGTYNGTTLATEIQSKMNLAIFPSMQLFTVNYAANKITIANGFTNFELLFASGINEYRSICKTIGFYKIDKTGAATYTGIANIYNPNASSILHFDAQTKVTGKDLTDIKMTIDGVNLSTILYWSTGSRADLLLSLSTYNTIGTLINEINNHPFYDANYSDACLVSRNGQYYTIYNQEQLIVNANETGNQTITFDAVPGTSFSGLHPQTRITGGVNDRFKIVLNNLSTDYAVVDETVMTVASGGETVLQLTNYPVKSGTVSGTITRTILFPPSVTDIPIAENVDFTVDYGTGKIYLVSPLVTLDFVKMSYTYMTGSHEIILGTQKTIDKICAKIQQEVRRIKETDIKNRAAYLGFTCTYESGRYVLRSGTGGTGSRVRVLSSGTANATTSLKIGLSSGGTEVAGSGSFVNSIFATSLEVATAINNATPTGFTADGSNNYLKLVSSVSNDFSRLQIAACNTKERLGFDNNDDSYSATEFSATPIQEIQLVTNESINTKFKVLLGWSIDNGNVTIDFYTVDDSNIIPREALIPARVAYIPTREGQITSRAAAIPPFMTPALYQKRIDAVNLRLNKKTGSYVRVGDKIKETQNTSDTIDEGNNYIGAINDLL